MLVRDGVVVVTGGGRGIGAALVRRFAAEGATGILVSDLDGAAAQEVADSLSGTKVIAVQADVTDEAQVAALVETAERELGPIDLFCSNAGVPCARGLEDTTADEWQRAWSVHVLAHVYAAKAVLPSMLARGKGYLLNTASAAGLVPSFNDPAYTATKHAAVGFADCLSLTYGAQGIGVSVLCPMGVRTDLLMPGVERGNTTALVVAASSDIIESEDVAESVIEGLADERFLILPHPELAKQVEQKTHDRDGWLAGIRGIAERAVQQ